MTQEPNQWSGRAARQITIAVVGIVLPFLLGLGILLFLLYLVPKAGDELTPLTILFAVLTVMIALASIVYSIVGLIIANDNIFCASGKPIQMAKSLYESGFLQSQTLLAVLVVGVVCVLMSSKLVQPSEGLPIITFATGFALGRQFKKSESDKVED